MAEQGQGHIDAPAVPGHGGRQRPTEVPTDGQQFDQAFSPDYGQESTTALPRNSEGRDDPLPSSPPLVPTRQSDGAEPPPYPSDPRNLPVEGIPFIQHHGDSATDPESETQVGDTPPRHPATHAGFRGFKRKFWKPVASDEPAETAAPTPSRKFTPIWKIWWPEVVSVLLGFSALIRKSAARHAPPPSTMPKLNHHPTFFPSIVIVVVLDKFDEHSLPDWPYNITLNTFLAVVSTFARAAFMFPVSVAISQAQWTWFLRDRPLHDFHLLDQASRSPWGSLVLLWRVRVFRHPVALGALLTVMGVVTSPVTQLAITYPTRDVVDPSGAAKAPSVRSMRFPRDLLLNSGFRNALILGPIIDASNFTLPSEPPSGASCSTGNCTFGSYHSLGVCMRTANITSHLTVEEFDDNEQRGGMPLEVDHTGSLLVPEGKVYTASLPGGFDMSHQGPLAVLTDMLSGSDSFAFSAKNKEDIDPLGARIASFVILYTVPKSFNGTSTAEEGQHVPLGDILAGIGSFRHEAVEVLFYLCVQTYETSIVNGAEENRFAGQLARRADDPAATPGLPFLDINCSSLAHDPITGCDSNTPRWDDILRLEVPESDGSLEEEGGKDGEDFSADYSSMELMAMNMKSSLGVYALSIHPDKMTSHTSYYSDGNPFSNTLFEDVLYPLNDLSNDLNNANRQTRLTNLYTNIATAMSSM